MADVDRTLLIEISGGEREAADLLRLYFASARDLMNALEAAATAQDRVAVNRAAHQIAGAAGTCGFVELEERARAIETEIEALSWDEIRKRAATLADRLDRAEREARDLFPALIEGGTA